MRRARWCSSRSPAGRAPRSPGELGIGSDELAEALASARKALRRTLQPLPASGWCERAERLISDRLDGELEERGAARLDVHLRNCPRCVEHERRLVQATDALVLEAAVAPAAPPSVVPAPVRAPMELAVVERPSPRSRPLPSSLPARARSRADLPGGCSWSWR